MTAGTTPDQMEAALDAVVDLADAWEARGSHLLKSATTAPRDVRESLEDAGRDFINRASLIRSTIHNALEASK